MGPTPDSRAGRGRRHITPASIGRILYAGSDSSITYDPGVTPGVAANGCTITTPPSATDITYLVFLNISWLHGSHGIGTAVYLDTTRMSNDQNWVAMGDAGTDYCTFGPIPVTVPGDGKSHSIILSINDSLATGNVTYFNRYIWAIPVSPI